MRGKGFAWSWHERVEPEQPRRPRLEVLAVRCPPEEKEAIPSSDPEKFFTEDHFHGRSLSRLSRCARRLDKIPEKELRALLTAAWRCQAPRALVKAMIAKRRSTLRAAN